MDRTKTRQAYSVAMPRCLTDLKHFSLRSLISATLSVRGTALIGMTPLVFVGLSFIRMWGGQSSGETDHRLSTERNFRCDG